jgi:hypothetical protein
MDQRTGQSQRNPEAPQAMRTALSPLETWRADYLHTIR